jgi:hypothetical protein
MNNQLSRGLTDIADEMADTDLGALRSRVGSRSRYLRVRRTVVQAAAAVVAVAGLVGGVVTVAGSNQPNPRNDDPASSVPASAFPSASSATEPVTGLGSASPTRTTGVPGTLTFLDVRPGSPIKVTRVVDGEPTTTTFGVAKAGDEHIAEPAPNGSAVAVIVSPDRGSVAPGRLQIITSTGQRRTLADEVAWGGGLWPAWTPDSAAVIVGKTRYDVASGAQSTVADLATSAGYLEWSPSGTWRANTAFGEDTVAVARADGSDRRTFTLTGQPGTTAAGAPTSVQAVSDDGRYLALGGVNSGPSHLSETVLVFDTQTRRAVTLPTSIGSVRHVHFRADGGMLIHSDKGYTIVAMNGTKGETYPAVAGVTGDLIAYRG